MDKKNKLVIKTQEEFDIIPDDYFGIIEIVGNLDCIDGIFKNAEIIVSGNARIKNVFGSGVIRLVCDSAVIENVYHNVIIKSICDNAVVKNVFDNVVIMSVGGSALIEYVYNNTFIGQVYDNAVIKYVLDSAVVKHVFGHAKILGLYGLSSVLNISGKASVTSYGRNIVRHLKSEKKIKLRLLGKTKHIVIPESKMNLKEFLMKYPVEQRGKNLILYKAVHKINKRYFLDYDKKFEYKIGKTIKYGRCKLKTRSCSDGFYVAHKKWAVSFERIWKDMALLECRVPRNKIIVAKDGDGKVKASELKVLREVPKNEW